MTRLAGGAVRRDGRLLLLLLAALQAAILFLGSEKGTGLFVAEPVANLEDGIVRLPAAKPPSIARLGGFVPEPDRSYLFRVRANAGLPFRLQMVDTETERATRTWEVPARGETATRLVAIEDWALAANNRLEIRNPTPGDLTVFELEVLPLSRAHRYLGRSIRPLAVLLLALFAWRHRRELGGYLRAGPERSPLDPLFAGLLFVVCFHLFFDAPINQVLDSKYSTAVSHQLLADGTVALPSDFAPALAQPRPYQLQSVSSRFFHFYPDAVPLLNAPLVAVCEWLGLTPIGDNGLFLRHHELAILRLAAALQAAALVALLFALGRLYLSPTATLALATLFAFGTQIFSSVSRPYWSHGWSCLLVTAALYFLLAPATRERRWAAIAAASCLSWSFFCRPPMAVAIVGVTVYLLVRRRRHLLVYAMTGAIWAALFASYSLHYFGEPIPPYFLSKQLERGVLGAETLRQSYVTAAYGTLLSPSRGLFVYVPFLALIPWIAIRHRRQLADRALAWAGLVICVAHWQLLSANRWWWGGQSYGPRLFADVLVWLFLLAALALPHELRRLRSQPRVTASAKILLAAVLIAASLFINIRGANSRATWVWDGTYFDWSDPQFLAGLLPQPVPPTTAERLLALRAEPDAAERDELLAAIVADDTVPKRTIESDRLFAAFVTWDAWTYGNAPAALIARNDGVEPWSPRLRLATWAPPETYPIIVRIEDGATTTTHRLRGQGEVEVELGPLPPGSRRLFLVWSDRAWTPGQQDPRSLGVKLLPSG